jgi:hypothetical protein
LNKMANDLNELGAGFFECLKDIKTSYQVHLVCLSVFVLQTSFACLSVESIDLELSS